MQSSSTIIVIVGILVAGCQKQADHDSKGISADRPRDSTNSTGGEIHDVAVLVESGALDDAAARLVKLRASAPNFSPKEAAQYRQTMQEAYSRALEAAQKGDPRGQAAVQLLRVAGSH